MIRWKLLKYYDQIWILIYFCCCIRRTHTLTVDNELVSARNDCFERVALEAMIPFEKTFKTEDTNSLRTCKAMCLQEGDKCQSISFGVHRRGNGTCQLSKEKYKLGSRPNGVIFDPDFDLYVRKTNCFDLSDNNLQDQSDNLEQTNGYGSTTPVLLPNTQSEGTSILLVEPSPTVMAKLPEETTRFVAPTLGYGGGDSTTLFTQGPPTTYEPSKQNVPSTPASNGDRLFFSQDIYPLYKYPTLYEPNYPAPNQEVYIPGGYAANAQEVDDRYRPGSYDSNVKPPPPTNYHGPPKPVFGLGYGTGYGYGQPESYNPLQSNNRDPYRLASYDNGNKDRYPLRPSGYDGTTPSSSYYPRPDNGQSSSSSNYGSSPNNELNPQTPFGPRPYNHDNSPTLYGNRPNNNPNPPAIYENEHPNSFAATDGPSRPSSQRPGHFIDFTNRPDASDDTVRPFTYGSSHDGNYMRRNGTAASRPGGHYNDDKHINTYFNPDDYLMGNKKRPGSYEDSKRPDFNRGPMKKHQPKNEIQEEKLKINNL